MASIIVRTDKYAAAYKEKYDLGRNGYPRMEDIGKVVKVKFPKKLSKHSQQGMSTIWLEVRLRDLTNATDDEWILIKASEGFNFLSLGVNVKRVKIETKTKDDGTVIKNHDVIIGEDKSGYLFVRYIILKGVQLAWKNAVAKGILGDAFKKYSKKKRFGGLIYILQDEELDDEELQSIDFIECDMNREGEDRKLQHYLPFGFDKKDGKAFIETLIRPQEGNGPSVPKFITEEEFPKIYTQGSKMDIRWDVNRAVVNNTRLSLKDKTVNIRIKTRESSMDPNSEHSLYGDSIDEEVRTVMEAQEEPEKKEEEEDRRDEEIYGDEVGEDF